VYTSRYVDIDVAPRGPGLDKIVDIPPNTTLVIPHNIGFDSMVENDFIGEWMPLGSVGVGVCGCGCGCG
jgi:hypothetical protein